MKILILYASSEGQSAKIARYLRDYLREHRHEADMESLDEIAPEVHLADYDGIILGASIHFGKHQQEAAYFVSVYKGLLQLKPTGFYSVSMTASHLEIEERRRLAEEYVAAFAEETGWFPTEVALFAGALQYDDYDAVKKRVVRWVASVNELATDMQHNYEYTDWEEVELFAQRYLTHFSQQVQ
ncbi:MAG: flavodoxin domain-containing protein [Phototrophicaceae bacterium]|jgi:menaquinone-dependent protoporphyrinogen oxidase